MIMRPPETLISCTSAIYLPQLISTGETCPTYSPNEFGCHERLLRSESSKSPTHLRAPPIESPWLPFFPPAGHLCDLPASHSSSTEPKAKDFLFHWFIYAFLGLGISFCLITCSGHIAAETASGHCLSCYMLFVFLLVLLESAITADVFLNSNWEEDFPQDPTGRFDEFKDFVKSNFEICRWIGLLVVAAQAFSIFLAIVLRVVDPDHGKSYDSDDDYVPPRLPLLRDHIQQRSQYVPDPNLNKKPDTWNIRVPETR